MWFKRQTKITEAELSDSLAQVDSRIFQFIYKEKYDFRRQALRRVIGGRKGLFAVRALKNESEAHIEDGKKKGYDWTSNLFQECLEFAVPKHLEALLSLNTDKIHPWTGLIDEEYYLDTLDAIVTQNAEAELRAWDEKFSQCN